MYATQPVQAGGENHVAGVNLPAVNTSLSSESSITAITTQQVSVQTAAQSCAAQQGSAIPGGAAAGGAAPALDVTA